jgi:hypothetical protein
MSLCAPRVTRHTSIRDLTTTAVDVCTTGDSAHIDTIFKFLPQTRQHGCFLLAQTPSFRNLFTPRTNGLLCRRVRCLLCTKCTLHSNHRLTVWYSDTQNDFSPGATIFSLHKLASPSGRNVNYDEKQLTGGGGNWVVPSICTGFVNTCPTGFLQ